MIRVAVDQIEKQGIEERDVAGSTTAVVDAADATDAGFTPSVLRYSIPFSPQAKSTTAAVYVRDYVEDSPLDSNDPPMVRYEAIAHLNGEAVFEEVGFVSFAMSLSDAVRELAAITAKSRKKAEKQAAKELVDLHALIEARNEPGGALIGEECEWPGLPLRL